MTKQYWTKHFGPFLAKLPPAMAALYMFAIMPMMLLLIRQFKEGGMYLVFWAVWLGDCVAFPLFADISSWIVRKFGLQEERGRWLGRFGSFEWKWFYSWPRWVIVLIYGLASGIGLWNWWFVGVKQETIPKRMRFAWSEHWHTSFFGVIIVLLLHMIGAVIGSKAPKKLKVGSITGLILAYLLGLFLDTRSDPPL